MPRIREVPTVQVDDVGNEARSRFKPTEIDRLLPLLAQGDLAVELGSDGEAVRHLWTPDDEPRMWAIVRIGQDPPFSKEFSATGSGRRNLSRLAKAIGDWLLDNSTILRQL